MIKKTVTYTDYNGEERTEDFYFNLTKSELTELQATTDGGLDTKIHKIIAAKDNKAMLMTFKQILLAAYGEKSDDGRHFYKSEAIRNDFENSAAFDTLFTQLASDENEATAFANGIIPADAKATKAIPAPVNGKR